MHACSISLRTEPLRLMIVDDEVSVRQLLREFLREFAFVFIECGNGREAIEYCWESPPDIVLMDISMPGIDGFEAARTIHSILGSIKIVVVTQCDSMEYRQQAKAIGVHAYFLKDNLIALRHYLLDQLSVPSWRTPARGH